MTQQIKGDALSAVKTALGLAAGGEQFTELNDGQVDQSLDITPMIRRGRTQAATDGLYTAIMQNVHTDAESLVSVQSPYDLTAGALEPYPDPMPIQFDVWLLGAMLNRVSGSGTLEAVVAMRFGATKMGWGIDDSGVAVAAANPEVILALWDALVTEGTTFGVQAGSEEPYKRIGIRLPRSAGSDIVFRSTSSLTSTYNLNLLLGVFPMSLGQDGII